MSDTEPVPLWKSACAGALALAFLWLGANELYEMHVLEEDGKNIEARVTNSRIYHGKTGASHEIQYAFHEEGGKEHTRGGACQRG